METSENIGGHVKGKTQPDHAADGVGHSGRETHPTDAHPEPNGGQESIDTQCVRAANGDERANRPVKPIVAVPAVAEPIESENGGGQRIAETQGTRPTTNGGGQGGLETQIPVAPAAPSSSGHGVPETHIGSAAAGGGAGQLEAETQTPSAGPTATPNENGGQYSVETQPSGATVNADEAGQTPTETQAANAGLIGELIAQHRQHEGLHRAEKSLTLQIKANCRGLCEGDKTAANELYAVVTKAFGARLKKLKAEAKKAAKEAGHEPIRGIFLQRQLLDSRDFGKASHTLGDLFWGCNLPFFKARNEIESEREFIGKRMEEIAAQFPVVEWWVGETGRNLLGLAQLIGETGLVSCDKHGPGKNGNYPNPGKLWARLCVSVEDGEAKRRRKNVDNGYNAPRRSVSWRIADSLFKGQSAKVDKETGEVKREAGPYRVLYDQRKVRELEKAAEEGLKVVPAAKIPKGKPAGYRSEGHIHKRALRYMEKRLLKHLWQVVRSEATARTTLEPKRRLPLLSFELGGPNRTETHLIGAAQ